MCRRLGLPALAVAIGVLLLARAGLAAPVVSWSFMDESIVAQPTKDLTILATIANAAAATDPLLFSVLEALGGTGAPPGGGSPLDAAYEVELVQIIFLRAVRLDPGESITLPWADLRPIAGNAAIGVYGPSEARLGLAGLVVESANLFTVTVVPEPTTALLVAMGLTGLGLASGRGGAGRRRRDMLGYRGAAPTSGAFS